MDTIHACIPDTSQHSTLHPIILAAYMCSDLTIPANVSIITLLCNVQYFAALV